MQWHTAAGAVLHLAWSFKKAGIFLAHTDTNELLVWFDGRKH
jgi:hypothetical protein